MEDMRLKKLSVFIAVFCIGFAIGVSIPKSESEHGLIVIGTNHPKNHVATMGLFTNVVITSYEKPESLMDRLEMAQAFAGASGDNDSAAAINFLQMAIVSGKTRSFAISAKAWAVSQ